MVLLRAKCLILGEPYVGKTAIVEAYHSKGKHFPEKYNMTTGVGYTVNVCPVGESTGTDGEGGGAAVTRETATDTVEMHMIDSAGQDVYHEPAKKMWGGASFVVYVYDVATDSKYPDPLATVEKWIKLSREQVGAKPGVLMGNKADLEKLRRVTTAQGQAMADKYELQFYEVSAKTGLNLNEAFAKLTYDYAQNYKAVMAGVQEAIDA